MKRALKRYYVVDQFHVIVALLLVVNRSRSMLRFVLRLQVFHSEESSTGEGLIASSSKNRWITRAQRVLDLTFLDTRATTSRFLHVSRWPAVDRETTRYHWPYVVTNVRSNSPGQSNATDSRKVNRRLLVFSRFLRLWFILVRCFSMMDLVEARTVRA